MGMLPENIPLRKDILEALAVPLIVILVGLGAFGLGRISVSADQQDTCAQTSSQ